MLVTISIEAKEGKKLPSLELSIGQAQVWYSVSATADTTEYRAFMRRPPA